jgi:hypothetical protein
MLLSRAADEESMVSVTAWGEIRRIRPSPVAMGVLLAATGLVVWTGLSVIGGIGAADGFRVREAWDTSLYFYLGVPVMAVSVAVAAFLRPTRSWRWPLWLVGGHQVGVLVVGLGMQSGLSLIILTIIFAILLSAVFAVPAVLGSMAARRVMERAYF